MVEHNGLDADIFARRSLLCDTFSAVVGNIDGNIDGSSQLG